jgi:hypothetical protein
VDWAGLVFSWSATLEPVFWRFARLNNEERLLRVDSRDRTDRAVLRGVDFMNPSKRGEKS